MSQVNRRSFRKTLAAIPAALHAERAAKPQQPFFLYQALTAPHTPWVPGARFQGRSKAGIYGDFVAQVDDTLGQVLRALEETNLTGNTLVIFTNDNGADWKPEDKAHHVRRANANWRGEKADVGRAILWPVGPADLTGRRPDRRLKPIACPTGVENCLQESWRPAKISDSCNLAKQSRWRRRFRLRLGN